MKKYIYMMICLAVGLTSCKNSDNESEEDSSAPDDTEITETPTYPATETGFARGADVSWVTEMEASGVKFYDAEGTETECMTLLQSIGFNAIRLRVWVDPTNGWCGLEDVVAKAERAAKLGLRVMVDFHYSDSWADPGQQFKPASWEGLSLADLKRAIQSHTVEVLQALDDLGIVPEWVQVGNEVRSGMLWDTDASLSGATWDVTTGGKTYMTNQENFASFITVGYNAVKSVFPDAKVIVHLDNGYDYETFKWIFDILDNNDTSYDVIGMSLYPGSSWSEPVAQCIANINSMISRYDKEVMICEVGMAQSPAATAKAALTEFVNGCKAIDGCLGVFYWEPECYNSWNGYNMGAFDNSGKPTEALDAFAR